MAVHESTLPSVWYNRGLSLLRGYEQNYVMKDLEEAIQYTSLSCDFSPPGHPFRSSRLVSLANCLARRFERGGVVRDIDTAIVLGVEAVMSSHHDHAEFPIYLSSVGSFYALRYQHLGEAEVLEKAISWTTEAIRVTLARSMDPVDDNNNLGVMLSWKYEQTGDMEDLEACLRYAKLAVSSAPSQDSGLHRPISVSNLADMLSSDKFSDAGSATQQDCFDYYCEVWYYESAPPMMRIKAAVRASSYLNAVGDWKNSSDLLCRAVHLLSTMSAHYLSQIDQQYILRESASISPLAASVMLQAGEHILNVIRVLEMGRGIIANLSLEPRRQTPGDDCGGSTISTSPPPEQANPGLRSPFCGARPDRPVGSMEEMLSASRVDDPRASIRTVPLYHHDVQHQYSDLCVSQLLEVARNGPIVMINESPIRCDAVLITSSGIRHLNLPNLRSREIVESVKELRKLRSQPGRRRDINGNLAENNDKNDNTHYRSTSRQLEILEWLWDAAAQPIMHALGFMPQPQDTTQWPRVWWVLTGQLSQLPIHAAGRRDRQSFESVMDRVVSSYSPSIKALMHSRRRASAPYNPSLHHVVVGMDRTPDLPLLACAREEASWVAHRLLEDAGKGSSAVNLVHLTGPTKREVMRHVPGAHVFHFAGHGRSNAVDPLSSCLLFQDWKEDPLTVQDLLNLGRERQIRSQSKEHIREYVKECNRDNDEDNGPPFLAYLSACGTALNSADDLQDESINLMSAFQIAGFRHIIGSLWEVGDRLAVEMAKKFYSGPWNKRDLSDYAVAVSAHLAARALRSWSYSSANTNDEFLGWAAYLHVGP